MLERWVVDGGRSTLAALADDQPVIEILQYLLTRFSSNPIP